MNVQVYRQYFQVYPHVLFLVIEYIYVNMIHPSTAVVQFLSRELYIMSLTCSEGESQSLLSPLGAPAPNESCPNNRFRCQLFRYICLPSKPAIVLICLAIVVGAVQKIFSIICATIFVVGGHYVSELWAVIISYSLLSMTVILYPISGFLADVFYGRFKILMISMCLFIVSFMLLPIALALVLTDPQLYQFYLSSVKLVFFFVIILCFSLAFCLGITSYRANFIQFGLDQLMEAPSEHLSLFIHWLMWADSAASAVIIPLTATLMCRAYYPHVREICGILPILCFISLIFLMIFSFKKRRWFNTELFRQHNPYKTVFKVLNFARRHGYPLQRSAFTYCDDERPSRLDFAKERFGGPFTTEQVENVKAFLRILVILVALGPIFVLDLSNSLIGFPLISIHIAHKGLYYCNASWILLESGTLKYITTALFFPIYICFIFGRRQVPRMFVRLGFGIFIFLLGVSYFLAIDVMGHVLNQAQTNNTSLCVFDVELKKPRIRVPSLSMHWATLIPANVLLGIGPLLTMTTVFEFISAQSPHSMKGLIIGLFLTIKTLFELLGALSLLPFSLNAIVKSKYNREHPPVTNCGFGYLLSVCVVATIGLLLFLVTAKRYKYRERDDRPYDHRFAIDYYSRTIQAREREGVPSM